MLNRATIFLLFIFTSSFSFAQDLDKGAIFDKIKAKYPDRFRDNLCQYYLDYANKKYLKDSLILPQYIFYPHLTETFKRLVKKKYNILDWNYLTGDLIPTETQCFDEYMYCAIQNKFGNDFFDRHKRIADSLDKIGKGYIPAKSTASEESLRKYIYSKLDINPEKADNLSVKYICFFIDANGNLTDAVLMEGSPIASSVDKSNKMQIEISNAINGFPIWIPAKFLGDKIEGTYLLEIVL